MAYNSAGAIDYAMQRWNTPCHDNVICTTTPWRVLSRAASLNAQFIQDSDISEHAEWTEQNGNLVRVDWEELDDCAHFVSCCIGKGGGLTVPSPVAGVYGHFDVGNLVSWLYAQGKSTQTFFKQSFTDAAGLLLSTLTAGDVIAYYSTDNGYTHSALYLDNGTIACHSRCRYNGPWDLGRTDGYLYTFIHFTA
jgi:hypothetical protein